MLRPNTLVKFKCNHRRNLIHNQPVEFKGGTWSLLITPAYSHFAYHFLAKIKLTSGQIKHFGKRLIRLSVR